VSAYEHDRDEHTERDRADEQAAPVCPPPLSSEDGALEVSRSVWVLFLMGRQCCRDLCRVQFLSFLMADRGAAPSPPVVELRSERVHRSLLFMHVTMNGHPLALLPPLDRAHISVEIGGNVLP